MKIMINVAMSMNGLIAGRLGRRVDISSSQDRERVMHLRSTCDAILVGANTIINDNPDLRAADRGYEKNPLRVVLDGRLSVPTHCRVFDGRSRTLLFTANREREMSNCEIIYNDNTEIPIEFVLDELNDRGIKNLLVEGGSRVIRQFLLSGKVSSFSLYIGNILIETGGIPLFEIGSDVRNVILSSEKLGDGFLLYLDPVELKKGIEEYGRRGTKAKLG